mmetsp:Transcript_44465/g.135536  ORF Transcript_44465/g.135536 Transcript_44465/m.135536 type:complete len:136 (+) Transcript_44465:220-627(+)
MKQLAPPVLRLFDTGGENQEYWQPYELENQLSPCLLSYARHIDPFSLFFFSHLFLHWNCTDGLHDSINLHECMCLVNWAETVSVPLPNFSDALTSFQSLMLDLLLESNGTNIHLSCRETARLHRQNHRQTCPPLL